MAWIEAHQSLPTHRKTLAAADLLDMQPVHVVGHLTAFWLWALDNAPEGSLSGVSARTISRAAQWEREPQEFVTALLQAGFLDKDDEGEWSIHNWHRGRYSLGERSDVRRAWESMAKQVRLLVFERDGNACVLCGSTDHPEADHIVPIALGGTNDFDNLQTLCRACNRSKGAR